MSSPLYWHALNIQELFSSLLFCKPKIYYDFKNKSWKIRKSSFRLDLYYVYSIGYLSCYKLICISYIIRYFLKLGNIPAIACVTQMFMIFFFIPPIFLALFLLTQYAKLAVIYLNSVKKLEDKIILKSIRLKDSKKLVNLKNELLKIAKLHKDADNYGFVILSFVIYSPLVGVILWLGCSFYKLDPVHYLLKDIFPSYREQNFPLSNLFLEFVHFISGLLAICEPCRTFGQFFVAFLWHQKVYLSLISKLQNSEAILIQKYTKIKLLLQCGGYTLVKYVNGVILGGGFWIHVFFNSFTFIGWKIFPLGLYAILAPAGPFLYIFDEVYYLPMIQCNERSLRLIKDLWPRKLKFGRYGGFTNKIMLRKIRTFDCVTFQCLDICKLTKGFRVDLYYQIMDKTMMIVLFFHGLVNSVDSGKIFLFI